jgi:hypothetical protein
MTCIWYFTQVFRKLCTWYLDKYSTSEWMNEVFNWINYNCLFGSCSLTDYITAFRMYIVTYFIIVWLYETIFLMSKTAECHAFLSQGIKLKAIDSILVTCRDECHCYWCWSVKNLPAYQLYLQIFQVLNSHCLWFIYLSIITTPNFIPYDQDLEQSSKTQA